MKLSWPFGSKGISEEPRMVRRLIPLKPCRLCGCREYGSLSAQDAAHCNSCGAMYLILYVADPVAKYVMEPS